MRHLVGQDLHRWRIKIWYELHLSIDEFGKSQISGYFTDETLALAAGKGKAWFDSDGTVDEVLVLTQDNKTGYLLKSDQISLSNQDAIRVEAIKKAKAKLTPEDRALLGIT